MNKSIEPGGSTEKRKKKGALAKTKDKKDDNQRRKLIEPRNRDSQFSFNTPEYPVKASEPNKHFLFGRKSEAGFLGDNLAGLKGINKKMRRVSF